MLSRDRLGETVVTSVVQWRLSPCSSASGDRSCGRSSCSGPWLRGWCAWLNNESVRRSSARMTGTMRRRSTSQRLVPGTAGAMPRSRSGLTHPAATVRTARGFPPDHRTHCRIPLSRTVPVFRRRPTGGGLARDHPSARSRIATGHGRPIAVSYSSNAASISGSGISLMRQSVIRSGSIVGIAKTS